MSKITDKLTNARNNKNTRLAVIVILMIVVAVLYFRNVDTSNLSTTNGIQSELAGQMKPDTLEKKILIGIMGALGIGLGMEVSNTDIDLGKLAETKSLSQSRVLRDKSGNVVSATSTSAKDAKYTDEYNCADFKTQSEAQTFFDNAGGVSADTNRLDGDKNGEACQSLPKK